MNEPGTQELRVDWTVCAGNGLCTELLPELLERDPWGYPLARHGAGAGGGVIVPAGLEGYARRAVAACPRLALHLDPVQPRRS